MTTIPTSTLLKFVSTDELRQAIMFPFRQEVHGKPRIFATDGHILISIPDDERADLPDIPEELKLSAYRRLSNVIPADPLAHSNSNRFVLGPQDITELLYALPDKPRSGTCPKCEGKPNCDLECSECDGSGKISLACHVCMCDHDVECCACEGTGKASVCDKCEGAGELIQETFEIVMNFVGMRRVVVNACYLHRILSSIPLETEVQIYPSSDSGGLETIIFVLNRIDVQFLLVPRRSEFSNPPSCATEHGCTRIPKEINICRA